MTPFASFASGFRLNTVLCCAAAVLATACGGDINDGPAIQQSATAADVTGVGDAHATDVAAVDPLEAIPADSALVPAPAPEAAVAPAPPAPRTDPAGAAHPGAAIAALTTAPATAAITTATVAASAPPAQAVAGASPSAAAPAPAVKLTGYETPPEAPAAAAANAASPANGSPATVATPALPSTIDPETGMPTAGTPVPAAGQ